jgi:hypothetical protein
MSIGRRVHRVEVARRRGNAAVVTVAVVTLFGLVVLGLLVWGTSSGTPEPLGPERPAPGPVAAEDAPPRDPEELRASSPIEVGADLEYKQYEKVFAGRGTISGAIDTAAGVPFPDSWELVIEPSKFGLGREHAETRVVAMPGAQRTFEEHDLPLAGYRVWARAAGLNCRGQEVLLFKLEGQEHLPGVSHKHLMLRFQRAGMLDGVVRDVNGVALVDLPVFVDETSGDWRAEVRTNGAGAWRVDGLLDGKYQVSLGSRTRPLQPVTEVVFSAPSQHLPDAVLPAMGSVVLRVVDGDGRGLPDAKLRGFGPVPIDATTDVVGEALQRFLLPGRYQLRAQHDTTAGEGKLDLEVDADDDGRIVEIVCRPR